MDRVQPIAVTPLFGMPLFAKGTDITAEILAALDRAGEVLGDGDVLIVAQKIVSKAEGRACRLSDVRPSAEARELAARTLRDPALMQLILDESSAIIRATPAAVITRHRSGHVLANAGIDSSNVEGGAEDTVLLWPGDGDASARTIRSELHRMTGKRPGVIIADSMGRAWRIGTTGTAIGCAGVTVLHDQRGQAADLMGRTLMATVVGVADSLAAMAVLVMGEGAEGIPVSLVRGASRWVLADDGPGASSGLRPLLQDMFQ